MSHKPVNVLTEIGRHFKLKKSSIGAPKLYLGGTMSKCEVHSPVSGLTQAWCFGSSQYVQVAVKNVVKHLKEVKNQKIPKSMDHSLQRNY